MNILITDDHSIVRHGLRMIVKDLLPQANVFDVDTFQKAVQLLSEQAIDLLILDFNIPGGNNIGMIEEVKLEFPESHILMFSGNDELIYAERCIKAGAYGYLSKNASPNEVKIAINSVLSGKIYISEAVKSYCSFSNELKNPLSNLSNRELEVAMLLVKGVKVNTISKSLNLQISTVSTYKNRIFEKLNVKSTAELIEKVKLHTISS